MTLEEYDKLPVGEPAKPVAIGLQYRIKTDRVFKRGDHVYYYEVINTAINDFGSNYESILKYDILE